MENTGKLIDFLKKEKMHVDFIDFQVECDKFQQEMENGLQKENGSSLSMLLTYIDTKKINRDNSTILVIDAGGTNFRTALVSLTQKGIQIDDFEITKMPGTEGKITVDEFFKIIADRIENKVDKAKAIGFCFSYPTEIMPNRDGQVLYLTKEVSVTGIDGKLLGEGINNELKKRNKKPLQVTVLNDTVASLLGGIAENPGYDTYLGFILGTGTNLAYCEYNCVINKKTVNETGTMIINLESGGYSGFPKGSADLAYIQSTKKPSMYQAEKVMSGAYLGALAMHTLKKAGESGLFSDETTNRINSLKQLETKDLGAYLEGHASVLNDLTLISDEKEVIKGIIDAIIERSALFSAIALTAAVTKNVKANQRVCITAEGTTWHKLSNYSERVMNYLNHYLIEANNIHFNIVSVNDATLIGSATAAMCD